MNVTFKNYHFNIIEEQQIFWNSFQWPHFHMPQKNHFGKVYMPISKLGSTSVSPGNHNEQWIYVL